MVEARLPDSLLLLMSTDWVLNFIGIAAGG